jgi:asparaginyl-tRNA synthetase
VLVPRLGEIIGGSEREDRLERLEQRIREMGMDTADYRWYLDLRRYGTAPHAGFGMGFERLIQYVTGMANIRDVIPYPRAVGQAEF